MNVIFDLDGTLIDSSERMYKLFSHLVPQSKFTKEIYWGLKRDKVNHKMLLERFFPEINFEIFNDNWMSLIEVEKFLIFDQIFQDTLPVLKELYLTNALYLLTARQSRDGLLNEMERLGIKTFFKEILTTEGRRTKKELLKETVETISELRDTSNFFVSDMGSDIQLGNFWGYRTVAITHGFMSRKWLETYEPMYLIDELSDLVKIINISKNKL